MYKWLLPTISEVLAVANADMDADLAPICDRTMDEDIDRANPIADRRSVKAQCQWYGAIAALSCLLEREIAIPNGQRDDRSNQKFATDLPKSDCLLLCSDLPVDISPELSTHVSVWKFISEAQLSAGDRLGDRPRADDANIDNANIANANIANANIDNANIDNANIDNANIANIVRLLTNDPLTDEQFCALVTPRFSVVMGIGEDATGEPAFQFSFDPNAVDLAIKTLRSRIALTGSPEIESAIDRYVQQLRPIAPDYKTVMRFSQLCLKYQPDLAHISTTSTSSTRKPYKLLTASSTSVGSTSQPPYRFAPKVPQNSHRFKSDDGDRSTKPAIDRITNIERSTSKQILEKLAGTGDKSSDKTVLNQTPGLDVELLQAIAHEVRTPLTTIRTLTRLLLKRRNLDADIIKRLETIDRECSEQIDRFGLIFRAVELETCDKTRSLLHLTSTSLADVFSHCIPRWQKQASRRNLTLDVILPPNMPPVVTDPTMLDQVLTGAIENFISSVPGGSEVRVKVMLAGDRLKMQLHSEIKENQWGEHSTTTPPLKSIGQLLMFQPETGNISLNLSTTKNLFHALGGKLIVRNRSHEGQVLTIFLPLEA